MTKQELAHIARLMYDLQEYCLKIKPDDCKICNKKGRCRVCKLTPQTREFISPSYWHITEADIERLERESNDDR